ncbi:MAG TPA: oligosaccharide repeat unit polymerase, partial [Ignavibacteriaceae bacterium]|nr:oligosaccharide repeat unit polymerase [Ignavibacteriaceae bacterium]
MIFKFWFNPVAAYTFVWGGMISLYELRLLNYFQLTAQTWFIIVTTYLIFFIGSVTPLLTGRYEPDAGKSINSKGIPIFSDGGKSVGIVLYILAAIGLFGALHSWYTLFKIYGSLFSILLSANDIYTKRTESIIPGMIPYIAAFTYAGLILAGMYTVYKKKLTFVVLVLLLAAVLRDIANFARVGILVSFVLFLSSFFLYKNFTRGKLKLSKFKMAAAFVLVITIIVVSASIVRIFRGSYESYVGASKGLSSFRNN